ncbi:hypothetical protein [Flagellimonas eckloniae]|nr:hypothetical protein [Allomuricauda eckloniae]
MKLYRVIYDGRVEWVVAKDMNTVLQSIKFEPTKIEKTQNNVKVL